MGKDETMTTVADDTQDRQDGSVAKYFDQVTIALVPVEYPNEENGDEEWVIATSGEWAKEWLKEAALSAAVPDAGPFVLDTRETDFEWGASGTAYTIILFVSQLVGTSLAWDGVKALARKLHQQRASMPHPTPMMELTDEEAVNRAKWLIQQRYREDEFALEVSSVEIRPPGKATVELSAPVRWNYQIDLDIENDLVVASRIRRSRRVESSE